MRLLAPVLLLAACSNAHTGEIREPDDTAAPIDTAPTDTGEPEEDVDLDGWLPSEGDCDDADAEVHPGHPELCDGKDNDCDGVSDADADDDGDGIADCEDDCPIYVDQASTGADSGTFTDPFLGVQDGIDQTFLGGCDTVRVRPGDYVEHIDFIGGDIEVSSTKGAAFTRLIGDGSTSVVTIASGESSSALLQGFTILGGGGPEGGGVYLGESDPELRGNVIGPNAVSGGLTQGGGVYLFNSGAWLVDNEITGNDAGYGGVDEGNDGGALFLRGGAPVIEGNRIHDNQAGDGGGIWMARSDALVTGNWISNNRAWDTDLDQGGQGGGIDVQIGTADTLITGNAITDNTASSHGGGIALYEYSDTEGDPEVSNNTIAFNEVEDTDYGAGLVGWALTRGVVRNNVIAFNRGVGVWLNSTTDFSYNDVYGNDDIFGIPVEYDGAQGDLTGVGGNLMADPRFNSATDDADWTNDDFTLRSTSDLVDGGDPGVSDTDGSRSDIGAHGGPNPL